MCFYYLSACRFSRQIVFLRKFIISPLAQNMLGIGQPTSVNHLMPSGRNVNSIRTQKGAKKQKNDVFSNDFGTSLDTAVTVNRGRQLEWSNDIPSIPKTSCEPESRP